jgi:DNA-binding MarR family transcriptional regulator
MLWVLLAQCSDAISRALERDYAGLCISRERTTVLYLIESNGGCSTPVAIARDLFRELHSVSEMLKRMEKDGLITRRKGSGKSKIEVVSTEKGRALLDKSLGNETDRDLFSVLTPTERKTLANYLWRLRSQALRDLGIPEWHVSFPVNPKGLGK